MLLRLGFTIAELDKVLLPYVKKSWDKAFNHYVNDCGLDDSKAGELAEKDVTRELEQGFQSLELKLNTVPSSRGDFAFTTVSFGQWDYSLPNTDRYWLMKIGQAILNTRKNGHGPNHKPVVFPKLVYLYDKYQIEKDVYSSRLFDLAIRTSAECMYPDYLSLTSDWGTVSRIYKEQKVITSPMGCRAYLSPWKNEKGQYITIGRCNIGAVSLNLPLILKICQTEKPDTWKTDFWSYLDDRLETIREFLKKRYEFIRHQKCSTNPLAFTQGGFYEGTKDIDDEVGDLVRYMTSSFGITALDEFTYLWEGKRIVENQAVANEVLKYIQKRIDEYKAKDGYLYALYGTPAESLCATQAKQYDDYCAQFNIDNVFSHTEHYSKEYFTNSFHCNVTEDITPIEKQNAEFESFHNCEGK